MSRGISNRTRLVRAVAAFSDWARKHDQGTQSPEQRLYRQITRGRWMEDNFISDKAWPSGYSEAYRADRIKTERKRWVTGLRNAAGMITRGREHSRADILWYFIDYLHPVDKSPLWKFRHKSHTARIDKSIKDRAEAGFYLVLIQHFMGMKAARELRRLYRLEKVRYRTPRSDRGMEYDDESKRDLTLRLKGYKFITGKAIGT